MTVRVLLLKNRESPRILLLTHAVTWTKELCALSLLCSQRINKHAAQRPIGAEAMRVIQRANKGGEQGDMSVAVSFGRGLKCMFLRTSIFRLHQKSVLQVNIWLIDLD